MAIIGLKIPADTATLLAQIPVPEKREPKDAFHVTILHLGDDLPIETVAKATQVAYEVASKTKPFTVSTSKVTSFPEGSNGVPVICAVDAPELHELHANLCAAFDEAGIEYSKKFPEFKPHITLAYAAEAPRERDIPTVSFTAGEFHLLGGDKGEDRIEVRFPLHMNVNAALRVAARYQRRVLAKKTENYKKLEAVFESLNDHVRNASAEVGYSFYRKEQSPEAKEQIAKKLSHASREALKELKIEFENPTRAKALQKYLTRFKNLTKMIGEWAKADTWAELEPVLKKQQTKQHSVWQKYIEYRSEALQVIEHVDTESEDQFNVDRWNVILWTAGKGDWDDEKRGNLFWILRSATKLLSSIGMGSLAGGQVFAYPSKTLPGATGSHGANASYHRSENRIRIALGGEPRRVLQSMVHETGHRAYWQHLSTGARAYWESFFDDQSGPPDVDTLIKEWEDFATVRSARGEINESLSNRNRHFYEFYKHLESKDQEAATWLEIIESKLDLAKGEKLNQYSGAPVKGDRPALDTLIENRDKVKVFLHPVTAYSATSAGELFAETFAHYALHGSGRIPEIVRDAFHRVLPQFKR